MRLQACQQDRCVGIRFDGVERTAGYDNHAPALYIQGNAEAESGLGTVSSRQVYAYIYILARIAMACGAH